MAMAWTALAIWFEPVRHLFELGQIGALLMLAVLWAAYSSRWWVSGAADRSGGRGEADASGGGPVLPRGAAVEGGRAVSAVVFGATVASSIAVGGAQARFYFTDLLGNANRIGVVDTPMNQSLRGVFGYLTGHDAGYGPLLIAAVAGTAVLSAAAWWRIGADDPLGRVVVVMVFGLLISPISWTHHWVWLLPLVMWLVLGTMRARTRIVGWAWVALAYVGPPWLVTFAERQWPARRQALVRRTRRLAVRLGGGGDAGLRRGGQPTIRLMSPAIATSLSVMPPSECVTRANVTVRQRMSMSGW